MEWLQIQRVRNLRDLQFEPDPNQNIFVGKNASGKTAILESIYLLARARSFRTTRIQDVIQKDERNLRVQARIQHERAGLVKASLEKAYGEFVIKRNGEKIKTVSDQASQTPVILITQETQTLISGAPKDRRHWLDWAMFHVEPEYLGQWRSYIKALRQRNRLLKYKEKNKQIYRGWEQAMVELAYRLTAQRERFLEGLRETLQGISGHEMTRQTQIKLLPGWPEKKQLQEVLEESRPTDMERGYTRAGIHQAEVRFTLENRNISASFSRGQIKLYAVFLLLAQAKEIQKRTGVKPVIIIDDFRAELDEDNSNYLLTWLCHEAFQSFLTTTEFDTGSDYPYRKFHVEHGEIVTPSKA